MATKVPCICGNIITVSDSNASQKVKCYCGREILIPGDKDIKIDNPDFLPSNDVPVYTEYQGIGEESKSSQTESRYTRNESYEEIELMPLDEKPPEPDYPFIETPKQKTGRKSCFITLLILLILTSGGAGAIYYYKEEWIKDILIWIKDTFATEEKQKAETLEMVKSSQNISKNIVKIDSITIQKNKVRIDYSLGKWAVSGQNERTAIIGCYIPNCKSGNAINRITQMGYKFEKCHFKLSSTHSDNDAQNNAVETIIFSGENFDSENGKGALFVLEWMNDVNFVLRSKIEMDLLKNYDFIKFSGKGRIALCFARYSIRKLGQDVKWTVISEIEEFSISFKE